MKKVVYTVSQLSLSGRGKKMWKHGDVVTESDFPENFNQLIKEGRIKVEESETEKTIDLSDLEGKYSLEETEKLIETIDERIEDAKKAEETIEKTLTTEDLEMNPELVEAELQEGEVIAIKVEESETEKTPLFIFVDSENNQRPIFTVKDITKAELQAYLISKEATFKPSEKEESLFEKAVAASKKAE